MTTKLQHDTKGTKPLPPNPTAPAGAARPIPVETDEDDLVLAVAAKQVQNAGAMEEAA